MHDIFYMVFVVVVLGIVILSWVLRSPKMKGKRGEAKIHNLLLDLPDEYYVFKDVILKSGNRTIQIDHIVVSKYAIFTIETKNYRGEIFGNDNSLYWTQLIVTDVTYRRKWYKTYTYVTKNKFYNPVKQSMAHAYAIKNMVKDWPYLPIVPIVVFTDMADISKIESQYCVISEEALYDTIINYRTIYLSDIDVLNLVERINVYDYREVISDREHVKNVKWAKNETDKKLASGICPRCGAQLVLRKGKYGSFWGCSNYPKCRFTTH